MCMVPQAPSSGKQTASPMGVSLDGLGDLVKRGQRELRIHASHTFSPRGVVLGPPKDITRQA